MKLKVWCKEIRPKFLLLSLVLVLLGTAISLNEGYFNWLKFFLTILGLLLAHTSVNILNDYYDYKSGIDLETTRTAFSGGSGILTQGLLKPKSVYIFGVVSLAAAFPIGIYLTFISGWQLLPLIIFGGLGIYLYTSFLTKWLIGELWAGLGLGMLPVLGTYFVQVGSYGLEAFVASLAPGFLTANLLLLNEFPDFEADRKGGRYNLVIALGRKKASRLYAGMMAVTYFCIIGGVVLKIMPPLALIALTSLPCAFKSVSITYKNFDNFKELIPALRFNVMTVLGTDILLAIGYFISSR
jgi:1,4-dihydroxy-2-naphthoate octaprenyltransferase